RTGPDGALWIADMYRAVIEHPEWIPDDWEARLDLRAGHDQGRIYRVYPVGASPRPIPRLDRLDTAGLVAALDSPNGWQRDTAQRLLLHRADRSAVPLLRRLLGARQRPKTRVQALWTLEELGGLEVKDILALLDAAEPEVRRNALQAGREVFKAAPGSSLDRLVALVDDPDSKVRFQLALTLGDLNDPRAARALAALLRRDGADPWARAAVLCSAKDHAPGILAELFARAREEPPSGAIIEPLFAMIDPDQGGPERRAMLDAILIPAGQGNRHAPWQFAALAGLLDAAERAKKPLDRWGGDDPGWKQALARLPEVIASARRLAGEDEAPEEARLSAIRVLGRLGSQAAEDRSALAALLRPQVPPRLQQAAVAALGRGRDEKTPEVLLADWKGYTPALRAAILDTLLSRDAWASALLFALEDTCVPPAEIGPAHRRRLLEHRDPKIRVRAQEVFSDAGSPRAEIVMRYREALDLPGDPRAGEAVFRRACASCHRLRGEGAEVGPDLTTLADKSPETLLIAILDPNRAFEARYQDYAIQTTDGRVLSGLIAAETATSVTLRRQEGKEETLLRSEIEAMAATGRSLMPEGLEKDLSTRDLADLIALLTTLGPPRKVVAGNQPELVQPGPDGTITLKATQAEIFGSILTLEPHYHNLGLWSAPDDRAAWTFQITRPGRFAVWIDAACADGSAGNRYILQVGPARLAGQVVGTGTWDHYRWTRLGTLSLSPGRHRLEFRPDGKIRGALIDLRTVELRPEAAEETPRGCCDPGE
ncbi:MAG: HEAT repeat domain-containing protein, partial [Isosphaeraceae bacterium]|nr:HEAT repeat domain-containing protein [Isosphaeraceae bacterium]